MSEEHEGNVRGPRSFTLAEEVAHSAIHGLGAALALPAVYTLMLTARAKADGPALAGLTIYGLSLVAMLAISSVFHGLKASRAKLVMATVDNDAVYVLIAGTYTAYCQSSLRGGSGFLLLGIIWSLTIIGICVRTFFPNRFRFVALGCYLAMGWMVVLWFGEMREVLPPASLSLLVAGGLSYSIGTVFYALDRIPWFHSVWHLAVIGGAACHFLSILRIFTP